MKLGEFILSSIEAQGVRHVFGIPGDYVLKFFQVIADRGHPKMITLSHEPAVGFAADAYARITNGLGVCCVTYGVGGLNMVNSIAGAYAERSPVVVLSGEPGIKERNLGILFHHQVKTFETPVKIYQEVTEASTVLSDPQTAANEIRRVIQVAHQSKRPVYIGIPRDLIDVEIGSDLAPATPLDLTNPDVLAEAVSEIKQRFNESRSPVLLTGVEVQRFGLREEIVRLAERLGLPVVSTILGKGTFPRDHRQFAGVYMGLAGDAEVRALVEESDCLLMLGTMMNDIELGFLTAKLDQRHFILAASQRVTISHHKYDNISLQSLIGSLLREPELRPKLTRSFDSAMARQCRLESPSNRLGKITVNNLICQLDDFLTMHKEMPLITDCGDCMFASIPLNADDVLSNSYYTSMGFAIPAALAVQIASDRRPLVLVGDGGFQMTGVEISHAPRHGLNPVVVVWNNGIWGMMKKGMPRANYTELPNWPYARLAELWGGRGFQVRTPAEFSDSLIQAYKEQRFSLLEVFLDPNDFSPTLQAYAKGVDQRTKDSSRRASSV